MSNGNETAKGMGRRRGPMGGRGMTPGEKPKDLKGAIGKLASYLIKEVTEKGEKLPRRYSPSKNLRIPEPQKEIILERKFFRRKPIAQKGYYIDQQSVYSGFTEDGYQFLRYIQVKIHRRKE
jgi:hypothetical protein